jgi:hypothetical protein
MNLICVAPWCGGTLIADLLNNEQSPFETAVLQSRYNNILKVDMQDPNAIDLWLNAVLLVASSPSSKGKYYATHFPIKDINVSLFEHVINVTIESEKSKWYRFLRMYYLSINGQKTLKEEMIEAVEGLVHICKSDTDWLYVDYDNVQNLELEDLIEGRFVNQINGNKEHFERWVKRNNFLFSDQDQKTVNIWNTCT